MNDLMQRFNDKTLGEFEYLKLNLLKVINSKSVLELDMICPQKYGDVVNKDLGRIEKVFADILKVGYKVEVNCKPVVFDSEEFLSRLFKFLDAYPIIKSNVERKNISIEKKDISVCSIKLDKNTLDYCNGINFISILQKFVKDNYYEEIEFNLITDKDEFEFGALELEEKSEPKKTEVSNRESRRIKVTEIEKYIGNEIDGEAGYIEDIAIGEKIFCGTVSGFGELKRKPKEGENPTLIKPFYKFNLTDFTGSVNCLYFPTKAALGKMSEVKDGVTILAYGSVEEDNFANRHNFVYKIKDISFCKLPTDFKPVVIKRKIPKEYICVFPKPYINPVQENLFGTAEEIVPEFLKGKSFCVFDTETTGLNPNEDSIIEIGAVIVKDGKITETFQSFINPHKKLTEKIIALTSITDKELVSAPELEDVLSDFYKFSASSALVGHNLKFDYDFISKAGKPFDFIFENEQYDTLAIAQRLLSLRHYRLEDVAKYYSIVNEGAHRAIYDALTTAKIFIKFAEKL